MRLLLSMLGWPDGTKPEIREIDGELAIGRGRESGWMLADPASQLSRRHCLLTPFGDGWRVMDLSLNGTFINESGSALGRQQSHELHDGDRIRIGAYVIEACYQAPSSLHAPVADRAPFAYPPAGHQAPADMPPSAWQPDAWAATPAPTPGGFDPHGRANPDGFVGQPSADHSPAVSDAWHAPPPGRVVIPEDWDLEDMARPSVPAAPIPSPAAPAATSPPPGTLLGDDWDHEDPAAPEAAPVPVPPGNAVVAAPAFTPPTQQAQLSASPPATPSDATLFAAFLRGVGLRDVGDADPVVMMQSVGTILRVMVDRLRAVQAARSTIKREFRILATVVHPDDNNPIKFSASNEAALRSLLTGNHPPDRAVGEILDEIRLHELAMIAAMRDAVRGLLEDLNPAHLRASEHGLASMLPVQRKARAFDQYEALHARVVQALEDDFDSVFGKAFARAYERVALDEENAPRRTRR
jgi:type VI secretion system protein ImpI/type VI secretion system protein